MARSVSVCCALLLSTVLPITRPANASCASETASLKARYEIMEGSVLDRRTGLTWNRCSVGQRWTSDNGCVGVIIQMNWTAAMSLNSPDWRVPTSEELRSLVVPGCSNPAIDEALFPDMELTKLWYWTSTTEGLAAFYVAFGSGSVRTATEGQENAVRLVRRDRSLDHGSTAPIFMRKKP